LTASELFADLGNAELGNGGVAPALLGEPVMRVVDGALATLDGDIHQASSTMVVRGRPARRSPAVK
jgi:hypothetical protein